MAIPITSVIQAGALLYVLYQSICALNKMGRWTPYRIRYAYVALVAGAGAGVLSCFAVRDIFECILAVGVALFMAGERRGEEK